ncbi:MAG TPA: aminotransferase [Marinobacter hydrocarbonoclasticus]|uniref:cysteine desulfurase family protein n=1 Tax=unclassified Oceanicaulis TaxID=2632123 RepID=UPI000C5E41C4|nr:MULTISPECIES: cysteine desulfurase family protein [unclassified Oceanicaulis]HCR46760.1 aminotransferase [Marinobacter nauticus]MAB68641.1 aminotransferase [Oceanicaulis sp.]MAB70423.1 aminotransferase [Oceanicaulis sp.]MBC39223.1 aminotransferase [Oceanicaulis sp.]HBU61739.1 aminotransferase [Oceanicaulis sp.]
MTVYLDHNATAPVRPEARDAVMAALEAVGNPSSVHGPGRSARARIETARGVIAKKICARAEDLVFTSGGTEANNLGLRAGIAAGATRVIVSAIEHDAVGAAAQALGVPCEIWPVLKTGQADIDWLKDRLQRTETEGETPILFALMAANNETGVIQPYAEAGRMIREAGHLYHIDAVQMLGKAGFDFAGSFAHFAAFSSHKLGGPQGVGALAVACEAGVAPQLIGGGQEKNRRAGTENVAGIAGFGAAAAVAGGAEELSQIRALRDELQARLKAGAPEITIWGEDTERLDNTLCLSAPGWPSEIQVIALDLNGFAVSAGSACSSGKVRKSKVLEAMGASAADAESALRISLGWTTTRDDIEAFANAWLNEYARLRPRAAV